MASAPRIRTFSRHYRQKYGEPIGKIPLDCGFVCPNRERGGCIFCRPASFTPGYLDQNDTIRHQIARGKRELLRGRFSKYLAYFQQETCTALPPAALLSSIRPLLADDDCIGLILSTRPDHVETSLLEPLAETINRSGKECLFELGLQSIHEESLKLLNRNHGFSDFQNALSLIGSYPEFETGAHLIFGIPGETEQMMLESIETICALGIDALKLHHLQVIRGTPLEQMYQGGEVQPLPLDNYLELLMKALPLIPERVVIHRLWATSHPQLLVAPKWNILAAELSRKLQEMMTQRRIEQGNRAMTQAC